MISFISSFEITTEVLPDRIIFLWIPASADATVNLNAIKTLLTVCSSTFFINGKPVYINGPRSLPRNLLDWMILDMFPDKLFVNDLWIFAICVLVNNSLCGKFLSSSPVVFIDSAKA